MTVHLILNTWGRVRRRWTGQGGVKESSVHDRRV